VIHFFKGFTFLGITYFGQKIGNEEKKNKENEKKKKRKKKQKQNLTLNPYNVGTL